MPFPSQRNLLAFCASFGLHAALLLSVTVASRLRSASPLDTLPNSVAMPGNAIEIEAPTPELAGAPAPAAPLDIRSLPIEPPADALPDPSPRLPPLPQPEPPGRADSGPKPESAKPEPALGLAASSNAAAVPPPKTTVARPTNVTKSRASAEPAPSRPVTASRAPSSGSDSAPAGSPAVGTFGQEGLAPGVRRLGYAFTRAIPVATPADPAWRELPPGHVGTIRIALTVDENNRLGSLERWQARPGEPPPPAVLQRMVERTLVLLRAGQFALSGSNQPGSERLMIDVTLRDETAEDDPTDNVVQKRFDGASPGHPGKAYFRYGSGRAFEAKITIVASGK